MGIMNKEEISQLIEDCENRESKMTDWEREFIQSISEQASYRAFYRALTNAQVEKLEKIWDRIT